MNVVIAKVFTSGNSQAIRLPKEFRLNTTEVYIYRSGDSLIVSPRMNSWAGFAEGFSGLSDDFSVTEGVAEDTPRDAFA